MMVISRLLVNSAFIVITIWILMEPAWLFLPVFNLTGPVLLLMTAMIIMQRSILLPVKSAMRESMITVMG